MTEIVPTPVPNNPTQPLVPEPTQQNGAIWSINDPYSFEGRQELWPTAASESFILLGGLSVSRKDSSTSTTSSASSVGSIGSEWTGPLSQQLLAAQPQLAAQAAAIAISGQIPPSVVASLSGVLSKTESTRSLEPDLIVGPPSPLAATIPAHTVESFASSRVTFGDDNDRSELLNSTNTITFSDLVGHEKDEESEGEDSEDEQEVEDVANIKPEEVRAVAGRQSPPTNLSPFFKRPNEEQVHSSDDDDSFPKTFSKDQSPLSQPTPPSMTSSLIPVNQTETNNNQTMPMPSMVVMPMIHSKSKSMPVITRNKTNNGTTGLSQATSFRVKAQRRQSAPSKLATATPDSNVSCSSVVRTIVSAPVDPPLPSNNTTPTGGSTPGAAPNVVYVPVPVPVAMFPMNNGQWASPSGPIQPGQPQPNPSVMMPTMLSGGPGGQQQVQSLTPLSSMMSIANFTPGGSFSSTPSSSSISSFFPVSLSSSSLGGMMPMPFVMSGGQPTQPTRAHSLPSNPSTGQFQQFVMPAFQVTFPPTSAAPQVSSTHNPPIVVVASPPKKTPTNHPTLVFSPSTSSLTPTVKSSIPNDNDDDESQANVGEGQPCEHYTEWKRLRVKKGISHFLCRRCSAKWKTQLPATNTPAAPSSHTHTHTPQKPLRPPISVVPEVHPTRPTIVLPASFLKCP